MPTRFAKFFRPSEKTSDGLNQSEREAIVDLLHYCMYADNHIALAEDRLMEKSLVVLDWDPAVSFEAHEAKSIARARAAKEGGDSQEVFLAEIQKRLWSKPARELALNLCRKLFVADGAESEKETALAARLRQLLG